MPTEPPEAPEPRITFLGPQRNPRLDQVVRGLGLQGKKFATITAGWRDRESDDALLTEQLGQAVNLRLWQRLQRIWERDPELAAADRKRRLILTEMQELYLIGLEQAAEGIYRLLRHTPRSERVQQLAVQDACEIMRGMDQRHLDRVAEVHADFYERFQPEHRDAVLQARFRVGELISGCDAVVIPGGHVGVLLGSLHLLNLAPALANPAQSTPEHSDPAPILHRPIIAWGAGAMALTERVVLFYDHAVARPGVAELLMEGLGLTRGVVALPSPRQRLEMKNEIRLQSLSRRCAPSACLLLEDHSEVTLTAAGLAPVGARVIDHDGQLVTLQEDHHP